MTGWQWLGFDPWLAQATAVATAIALTHLTRTLHPPGGATALIAPLAMLAVALVVNNLAAERRYPEFWI